MTTQPESPPELPANAIAIVGMSVHAPGARGPEALWQQLLAGQVLTETPSDSDLRKQGVSERLLRNPRYVRRTLRLPGVADFEPEFFGFTPRDAGIMDPQLRHLLECAWEALEDAGVDPARPAGPIGLFVGAGFSEYAHLNLLPNRELLAEHGLEKILQLGNDRDFIASRIAYALDLRGPVQGVAAACASGSLSVHGAVQSLLGRECRVALAGGASLQVPHGVGYLYEPGGIGSPEGVCRSFDANAQGTVPSSAAAMVALMRLEDALEEGRDVYATILATAFNNDGRRKVGYTAPSVEGPLSAIEEALAVAGVDARSIGFVEAHGTGTPFGDSIEVSALTKAFRQHTDDVGFCVLGANKPNVGHTDAASGVIALIKAAWVLRTRTLPPLANFEAPHPLLELPTSPFTVVTSARPFPESETPRRALANTLAIGGTNVHVVLEEAPAREALDAPSEPVLLPLSARSAEALAVLKRRLADHLVGHPELSLRDVAHTLQAGRRVFAVREALVASSLAEAVARLRGGDAPSDDGAARAALTTLGTRFVAEGEALPPEALATANGRFAHLPTYPWEHRAFWIHPPAEAPASKAAPRVESAGVPYAQVTFREAVRTRAEPSPGQRWLVFTDVTGLGDQVIAQLERHRCEVVRVRLGHGPALSRHSATDYSIDCDRGFEGPAALINELAREGRLPDVILHLWPVTTDERFRSTTNRFHHDLERGYFTLLALCQSLAGHELPRPVRIVAVTNGALSVGDEPVPFPAKALSFGPIATVGLEQPGLTACAIDVSVPIGLRRALSVAAQIERGYADLAASLVREAAGCAPGIYALRAGKLLARGFATSDAPERGKSKSVLRAGGTYLIVGGFGNLGHAIARELLARAPVKLALVGRTPIPDRAYWEEWLADHPGDDPVSQRIQIVRALEARGAEVVAASADVCHLESMSSALTLVRRRLGQVHGVIHAAGTLSEALCGGQTLDEARDAIAPEVLGVRVLEELLRREKSDFFLTFGNATRFAPRPGTYARTSASEFADAFRTKLASLRPRMFDLGLVRDGGMFARWAAEIEAEGHVHDPHAQALLDEIERGLSTDVAARAIVDALESGTERVTIGPVPRPAGALATLSLTRSELKREFVAPEGDVERKLAAMFAEALRIDRVGATDDFFELGGHSLVAVRLSARIKAAWNVQVPLALIVEAPTVRDLAKLIAESIKQPGRRDQVQLLREWSTIVPLQPHGERPPLFCVGGKGGNVMNLRHLARLLGRDQPVFGLQARGVDGQQKPHETLDAMVDEYIADVLRFRPKGPFLLSGFSGGGALILEIARKLRAQGHVVGPLLFLDAWNPATPERTSSEKLRAHGNLFRELGPRYAALFAQRTLSRQLSRILHTHTPTLAERIWEAAPLSGNVVEAWESAAADYTPGAYAGDAVLFRVRADRTRGELEYSDDEQNGWGDIVLGGLEVIEVPGTHTSLVEEPHVRTLAQSVRTVLDRTLRKLGRDRDEANRRSRSA
ncbi:MAG: beta-ketoacyl synthase N-terminal-like domain-containing protein [Polyangiales bacterium]